MPEIYASTLPYRGDTQRILEVKILEALSVGTIVSGGISYYEGHGDPNGIQVAVAGSRYRDLDTDDQYLCVGNGSGASTIGSVWI